MAEFLSKTVFFLLLSTIPLSLILYARQQTINNTAAVPMGPSGALISSAGVVDIDTAIVPRLAANNPWTGYNQFQGQFQLAPTTAQPPCATADDVGRVWIDSTDPQNTKLHVCLMKAGQPGFLSVN